MTSVNIHAATSESSNELAGYIYDSSHELLGFIFGGREAARAALTFLLAQTDGHFGYKFATVLLVDDKIAGVELGYDRDTLAQQNLPGTIKMFRAVPFNRWPHLAITVGNALSGYVPPLRQMLTTSTILPSTSRSAAWDSVASYSITFWHERIDSDTAALNSM